MTFIEKFTADVRALIDQGAGERIGPLIKKLEPRIRELQELGFSLDTISTAMTDAGLVIQRSYLGTALHRARKSKGLTHGKATSKIAVVPAPSLGIGTTAPTVDLTKDSLAEISGNPLRPTGPAPQIVTAQSDEQAVAGWLNEYADTKSTYNSYAKEATRLLLFLKLCGMTLKTLNRQDVDTFKRFLQNPPKELIGPPKPRKHPEWKPFVAPLSETSLRYAMNAARNLLSYLQNTGHVEHNPFALMRVKRHSDTTMQERYLDNDAWETVKRALRKMPQDDHTQVVKKTRARWVVSFLYLTGARRSEAAAAEMRDFRMVSGHWWWYVTGRGNKREQVPASNELLRELMLYRRHLGLMTLPKSDEPYPAILPLPSANGEFSNRSLSGKRISEIVAEVFKLAAEIATSEGQRRMLLNATTHWIRHTSATHQIELGLPVQHVSAILRHRKIDTTLRCVHQDRHEQHELQQSFKINLGNTNEDVPGTSNPADSEKT